jgi:hypothetical protein
LTMAKSKKTLLDLMLWPLLTAIFAICISLIVVIVITGVVVAAFGWMLRRTRLPGLHWLGHVIGNTTGAAADRVLIAEQRYDAWVKGR